MNFYLNQLLYHLVQFKNLMIVGTVIVSLIFLCSGRRYNVAIWKRELLALLAVAVGYVGCLLMKYVESRTFEGRSFYGTVFLLPLVMPLMARLMNAPKGWTMDASAVGVSYVSVLMKIVCYYDGCCGGKLMGYDKYGWAVYFPSQIAESVAAFVIGTFLLILLIRRIGENRLYPLFMVIYGIARFILHCFRDTEPFWFGIPAGNIWSIVSVCVGAALLHRAVKKDKEEL